MLFRSAIAGALARDMVQGASNEVNTTSQQLREAKEAVANAATDAQKAAAEIQQASAQAAADAADVECHPDDSQVAEA